MTLQLPFGRLFHRAHSNSSPSRTTTLSSVNSNTDEGEEIDMHTPSVSHIYTKAAEFENVLSATGCCQHPKRRKSEGGDEKTPIEGSPIDNGSENQVGDITNYVNDCLTAKERASTARLEKLNTMGFSLEGVREEDERVSQTSGSKSESSTLPRSTEDLTTGLSVAEKPKGETRNGTASPSIYRPVPRETEEREHSWQLSPDEIIKLLEGEFGVLADENVEEKLLLETDGCLFHDVVIVGVIHLTTHRLAFHASLLSVRPDLLASQQIIKSGAATIHRKGLLKKRRVWMELTHDMICSYSNNHSGSRAHPRCSLLLHFIKDIRRSTGSKSRLVHIYLHDDTEVGAGIEFDTEESAQEWSQEIQGALFLYRHQHRKSLDSNASDSTLGIKISCPLDRIVNVTYNVSSIFPLIAAVRVGSLDGDENADTASETSQIFNVGPVMHIPDWKLLPSYVQIAKSRLRRAASDLQSPVVVDFGPLAFLEENIGIVAEDAQFGAEEMSIRTALALHNEPEVWYARARLYESIASYGYFIISTHYTGFWSKNLTKCDSRMRFPIYLVRDVGIFHFMFCRFSGMELRIEGQEPMRFAFATNSLRETAVTKLSEKVKAVQSRLKDEKVNGSGFKGPKSTSETQVADWKVDTLTPRVENISAKGDLMAPAQSNIVATVLAPVTRSLAAAASLHIPGDVKLSLPKVINLPPEVLGAMCPLHFKCLTIGSRGDVQPYIALGLRLMKEGHKVTIVTHEEYQAWIERFGISHQRAGGDPTRLMKLSVDHKMFSPQFFKESIGGLRTWLDELLHEAWKACKDADVLIESPSAFAGIHIAEACGIPHFRAFTMPWTKTSEFPHPFLSPPVDAPSFNNASYALFNSVLWAATSGQINRWRKRTLGLRSTDLDRLERVVVPFIYNFSKVIVPKPLDWGDNITISGYWFLNDSDPDWSPPPQLLEWMAQARRDGKPIVYIGFGSITIPHPNRVQARLINAIVQSDVRAIMSKGWSDRSYDETSDRDPKVTIPPQCYTVDKVPHDWLFSRIDAALHHGGAGTTAASLRAGIPTLIKPWFGDQYFWAARVQKLGVGLRVPSLHVNDLVAALKRATSDSSMKERAALVKERIREENGVHTAVYTIYSYLSRMPLPQRPALRPHLPPVIPSADRPGNIQQFSTSAQSVREGREGTEPST